MLVTTYSSDRHDIGHTAVLPEHGRLRIGRGLDCHFVIDDQSVSRSHCEIRVADGKFLLVDCDSTNGTFLRRLGADVHEACLLEAGDEIVVGPRILRLVAGRHELLETIVSYLTTDVLSGGLNERAFREALRKSQLATPRRSKRPWLLAVDVRNLDVINDEYGLRAGDRVLAELGNRLKNLLPADRQWARIRGRRFAVLDVGANQRAACREQERLATAMGKSVDVDGEEIVVSIETFLHPCPRTDDYSALLERWSAPPTPEYSSAFISYGGPDVDFARKLDQSLHEAGVQTYLFYEDSIPGTPLHEVMFHGVNSFDRMLLVCSQVSLSRPGVQNELRVALAREASAGGENCIIPLLLDDYFYKEFAEELPQLQKPLANRVLVEYSDARFDADKFERATERLLRALRSPASQSVHTTRPGRAKQKPTPRENGGS